MRTGRLFFAENENLAICGTGENKQEAIQDFMIHLIHFYEYYKAIDENKLIGKAISLKKSLSVIIPPSLQFLITDKAPTFLSLLSLETY